MTDDPQQKKWKDFYGRTPESEPDPWPGDLGSLLGPTPGLAVIDLGCGAGNTTGWFLEKGHSVVAADYAAEALTVVKARFPRAETRELDLRNPLPWEAHHFDVAVASLSLHYFSWATTQAVFGEISRVLRPGAWFLFRVNSTKDYLNGAGQGDYLEENFSRYNGDYKRFFDRDQLDRLLSGKFRTAVCREHRFSRKGKEKAVWEVAAQKHPVLHTPGKFDKGPPDS